ncbi:MAG: 3-deoxy-7-phosphoheptulonate synthase [Chloroflexi bacterium]|nr:3-deoxy-7-phosphoheptulonate synthase [Chloroflexota bacterium]
MMVIMKQGHSQQEIDDVLRRLEEVGLKGHTIVGVERTVVAVVGSIYPELGDELETMSGVGSTVRISVPHKLASREIKPEDTIVKVGSVEIGAGKTVIIAGPCAVESEEQIMATARAVKDAGANLLRGGAFKPRSSPYSFRGLGEEGLRLLAQASKETGLPFMTEVMSVREVDLVAKYADVLQIGTRNAQNFMLLEEVGRTGKPVLLKRGLASQIEDWLLAAEYILNIGNPNVILCERGIRTFETATRNTFDINAIPLVKQISHLPIVADPSHGTGKWTLVGPVSLAAIAAGADGVILEVHPNPDHALSDGAQSLNFRRFRELMEQARVVAEAVDRPLLSAATEPAPA